MVHSFYKYIILHSYFIYNLKLIFTISNSNSNDPIYAFNCNKCDKGFSNKSEFMYHKKAKHRNYVPDCRKRYFDRGGICSGCVCVIGDMRRSGRGRGMFIDITQTHNDNKGLNESLHLLSLFYL
jgi:hypothetical protein